MPINSKEQLVFDVLDNKGIKYKELHHPAVHTIEEMDNLNIEDSQYIVKNLFLRDDKKKRFFLVVLKKETVADLKMLKEKLNSRPLSFASEEYLKKYLNLEKGSVTPFGILNDVDCKVEVVFDSDIETFEYVGVHPNQNTTTVWLAFNDLKEIIKEHGNTVTLITF